jgi:hypothetical protein
VAVLLPEELAFVNTKVMVALEEVQQGFLEYVLLMIVVTVLLELEDLNLLEVPVKPKRSRRLLDKGHLHPC